MTAEMILKTAKDYNEEILFKPQSNLQHIVTPGSVKSK